MSALRLANGIMAVLLLGSAGIQWNDPDPLPWMAIYGAGALSCVLFYFARREVIRLLPAVVGVISLVWGFVLVGALLQVRPAELFESMQMKSPAVEEGREAIGLFIEGLWMMVLAVRRRATF